ncbi:MAG: DNA translocase FtsK, partial [Candidatus Gallimonas sp.]
LDTLAGFHVEAEIVGVTSGATVTRYDIDIPKNVASSSVIKRSEEIAMRLHAQNGVNVYTNWEKGAISIEVPNRSRATVGMKSVMESDAFRNTKPTALTFVIGKDIEGRSVCGNIDEMTHVLVAGTTGSGKSICLHALLTSLICKYSPEELRIILIDPKKNEFTIYDGIPHLMINEIITDAQKTVTTLNWAIKEMERRYALFNTKTMSGCAVRKIDEYNEKRTEDEEKLPKIVIVVDEFADLMSVAKKEIEERIQRLSQKARAAGIHLVIATQRPSVDVVTGVIKANLPSRIALRVTSEVDSRIMLDESGAEKLLGNGDLLFSVGGAKKTRAQGAFVSTAEAEAVVKFIKEHNESYFDENVSDYINTANQNAASSAGGEDDDGDGVDPQYIKALGMVVKLGSASISLIQRKCSVGYNHAGKIIDWMEVMGYISPFDGKAKARTVLLTKEEYESKYGSLD